jgi:hypothetical protein
VIVNAVPGVEKRGWLLLFAVTPLLLAACAGFAPLNRKCLEPLRDRVRSGFGRWPRLTAAALADEPPR